MLWRHCLLHESLIVVFDSLRLLMLWWIARGWNEVMPQLFLGLPRGLMQAPKSRVALLFHSIGNIVVSFLYRSYVVLCEW
ncbi:hypothetical protein K449DRAFT_174192 [Hypoxylon sp. EC38]|nr:hypothetical protein K449DRAFT_174192 [Hypoxylon sp. EC38]